MKRLASIFVLSVLSSFCCAQFGAFHQPNNVNFQLLKSTTYVECIFFDSIKVQGKDTIGFPYRKLDCVSDSFGAAVKATMPSLIGTRWVQNSDSLILEYHDKSVLIFLNKPLGFGWTAHWDSTIQIIGHVLSIGPETLPNQSVDSVLKLSFTTILNGDTHSVVPMRISKSIGIIEMPVFYQTLYNLHARDDTASMIGIEGRWGFSKLITNREMYRYAAGDLLNWRGSIPGSGHISENTYVDDRFDSCVSVQEGPELLEFELERLVNRYYPRKDSMVWGIPSKITLAFSPSDTAFYGLPGNSMLNYRIANGKRLFTIGYPHCGEYWTSDYMEGVGLTRSESGFNFWTGQFSYSVLSYVMLSDTSWGQRPELPPYYNAPVDSFNLEDYYSLVQGNTPCYPNPFESSFILNKQKLPFSFYHYYITDRYGSLVQTGLMNRDVTLEEIDASELQKGVFILRLVAPEVRISIPLVKY